MGWNRRNILPIRMKSLLSSLVYQRAVTSCGYERAYIKLSVMESKLRSTTHLENEIRLSVIYKLLGTLFFFY